MYNQSEFGNLENYLIEKKYCKKAGNEQTFNTYVFTGAVEFKKYRSKKFSLFLINTFDKKVLEIMGKIFSSLFITIALATILTFLKSDTPDWFYILGISFSLAPLTVSFFIQSVLEFYQDTFCKKCGNKLAFEEIGEPILKETSSFGEYNLTVIRYWKCRYCGSVDIRESPENIFAEQGEMLPVISLKGVECKKCSGVGTIVELKKPDIKEIGDRRITRRYYKCTLCCHEDIIESEEKITRSIHAY